MKHRLLNRIYAWYFHYDWVECPVCRRGFGGHEWSTSMIPKKNTIPVRIEKNLTMGLKICPDCIELGVGDRAWRKARQEFKLSCAESWEARRTG